METKTLIARKFDRLCLDVATEMTLFAFCLSLSVFLAQMLLYPELPLLPFVPFVAFSCLEHHFSKALLWSAFVGLIVDLFSSDPLALHALAYTFAAAFCFQWKKPFSSEAPFQFSCYTAFCSFSVTLIQLSLLFLFDRRVPFPGQWWIKEWFLLPFFDALYALIWFVEPLALYRALARKWTLYWLKRKNLSPN